MKNKNRLSSKKIMIGNFVIVSLIAIVLLSVFIFNKKNQSGEEESIQEAAVEENVSTEKVSEKVSKEVSKETVSEEKENKDAEESVSEEDKLMEYLSKDLTGNEKKLGITLESRKAFVEKYGVIEYEIGLHIAPNMLFYNEGNNGTVSDSDTDMYKDDYQIETIEIESTKEDGYIIPADYVTNGDYNRDTVILVHGAGENRRKLYWRTTMFLNLGYNVLQYDQRTCGESKATYCAYGFLEQYDLYDCIKYVKSKAKDDIIIAAFGSSQGGATIIQALNNSEIAETIDVAILDCPVISQVDLLIPGIKAECPVEYQDMALDSYFDFLEYFFGFDRNKNQHEDLAKDIDTPILMFISEKDEILNVNDQKDYYEKLQYDKKYLFVSDSAKHCCIAADHEAEYEDLTKRALTGELFE